MSIDYLLQFKSVTEDVILETRAQFRNERMYVPTPEGAKAAFQHAQRVEGRGIDVAFAHCHPYLYVWTGAKEG